MANRQVTGRVTATTGEALPGVTVVIKGTQTGTVTDVNGNYTMNIPDKGAILVFTYIGCVSREVRPDREGTLNVQLAADAKSLNAVVVVGYGTQRK